MMPAIVRSACATTRALSVVVIAGVAVACAAPEPDKSGAPAGSDSAPSEAATAVSASADSTGREPAAYRAIGTEPFWGLSISGDELRFSTPDNPEGLRFPATTARRDADTLLWSGSADGTVLEARIWPGECSDNMSDSVHTHTAHVRIGGSTYEGCANALPDSTSR